MKNIWKLMLDSVMLLVLILMYQKQVISMTFHEAGGLALLGLFFSHLVINHKWITAVTKKLFAKVIPWRVRAGYLINILLLVSFLLIGLSGIMISKQLFSLHGGNFFKTMHYAASAFALILMGIHIALHWRFIAGVLRKKLKLSGNAVKLAGVLLTAAVFCFGMYSTVNSSFLRWLVMPFSTQGGGLEAHGNAGWPGVANGNLPGNLPPDSGMAADQGNDAAASPNANASEETGEYALQTKQNGSDDSASVRAAFTGRPDRFKGERPGGEMQGFSILNVLTVIAKYGSITGMVAVAACLLGKWTGRFLKRKAS